MMKKIIIVIISIFSFVCLAQGQDKNSFNDVEAEKYIDTFCKLIQSKHYKKAYLMLDEKLKNRESYNEFALYFESVLKYYGKLKSYKCKSYDSDCIIKSAENIIAQYEVEFKKIKGSFYFILNIDNSNNLKSNSYFFIADRYSQISDFDKMSKNALKLLVEKDYQGLFDMVDRTYSLDTYDDFKRDIKKLEVSNRMNYKLKSHTISVYSSVINFSLNYEINEEGDIIFMYEEENGLLKLKDIHFYFTKEIQAAYDKNLQQFMDTTRLFKDKEILSKMDSITLIKEFDKIDYQRKKEERDIKLKEINNDKSVSLSNIFNNDVSAGIAYDWNQLDESDQTLIKQSSDKYLDKLAENDIKGFWELCHSKFKETTPYAAFQEVGLLMTEMITSVDSLDFIDAKKVVYTSAPKTSRFTTGGSLDKSNPTYLQFYTLAGIENQSLTLYKLNKQPLSKIITMKFGLDDSIYKLTSIEINTTSVNTKNAKYYINIAEKWKSKESAFPRFIALNMAYRLSYLGKGTLTSEMIGLTEELQTLQKNSELIKEIKKWNVNDSLYDIINVDFLETQSDLTPNIIYLSKVELGEELTEAEVTTLFKYFKEKYPDLVEEFGMFIFTAYEEYPVIPTKQYNFYRVIMDLNNIK